MKPLQGAAVRLTCRTKRAMSRRGCCRISPVQTIARSLRFAPPGHAGHARCRGGRVCSSVKAPRATINNPSYNHPKARPAWDCRETARGGAREVNVGIYGSSMECLGMVTWMAWRLGRTDQTVDSPLPCCRAPKKPQGSIECMRPQPTHFSLGLQSYLLRRSPQTPS